MAKKWSLPPTEALRADGLRIADLDASGTPGFEGDKKQAQKLLIERAGVLSDLQEKLYANGRSGDTRSVLLVLQGMDTAGKGGIVRHVIGAGSPMGIRYTEIGRAH